MSKRYRLAVAASAIATLLVVLLAFGVLKPTLPSFSGDGDDKHAKPTYVITADGWTILRNRPGGLAIGNALAGWPVTGLAAHAYGYAPVYVGGDFNGCAWTARSNLKLAGGRGSRRCANFNPSMKKMYSAVNCLRCSGGTAIRVVGPTPEFANYSPDRGPRNQLRSAVGGHCVEWRWVTANKKFVMVKDRSFSNNQGSWVFIPRSSLPARLIPRAAMSCSHLVPQR